MPAIITNKFRIHNAEQFSESFSESSANVYYLFMGRPQDFGNSTDGAGATITEGSEASPPTPNDDVSQEFYYFDDMLSAKRIISSDVSYVIPRRNWTTGTVYDQYRDNYSSSVTASSGATNLWDSTFYVRSSANHIYKCLFNNSGAASTVEPTGTDVTILTTGDGYKWKYMYSLSASQQINFLSTDFMAVATNSTVQAAAVDGALDTVLVTAGGSAYTTSGAADTGTITSVPIRGDGSSGVCTVTIASGAVTSVTVTTAGTGYTFGYITNADIQAQGGGTGTGATFKVVIPPKNGHGYDAVKELGGFYVMLNTNFEGTESSNTGDFTVANDFRRIGIVRDPTASSSALTATTVRSTKAIKITGASGSFTVDEEINQATTGAVGKVVEWDSTNSILHYIQTRFADEGIDSNGNLTAFSGANVITGQSSGVTGTPDTAYSSTADQITFSSGYASSEIDADSGDVIYVENRAKITRAADQTENVKLVIEF